MSSQQSEASDTMNPPMHHMLREILEQPEVVQRLVEREREPALEVARLAESARVHQIVLAARGTSDHAAVYGQYLFQIENHLAAFLATPSIVTLYNSRIPLQHTMVIGISQSGGAKDVLEYMCAAKEQGSPIVAITNNPASDFGRAADVVMPLDAGAEKSVAATKTYTASLASMALISAAMLERPDHLDALNEAPGLISQAIQATGRLAEMAEESRDVEECFVIGRGLNYTTALESALKVMETSYVRARAYSSADLMHGPVAAARAVPCIIYAPHDAAHQAVVEVAERLRDFGTRLLVVSSDRDALSMATDPIPMPLARHEFLNPLAQIVAGQKFAYHLSVAKGLDPDNPRGLSKVTVTF